MMAPSTPICLLPPLFSVCLAFFFLFCFFRLCLSPLLFIIWPICGLMAGIPALLIVKKSWLCWKFRANSSQMGCMWEIWSDSKWAPPLGVAQAKESAVGHLTESPICLREELGQFFELNLIEYPSVCGGAHGPGQHGPDPGLDLKFGTVYCLGHAWIELQNLIFGPPRFCLKFMDLFA